jgi:predicted enzyme related to lactoylglutathione lyase
MLADNVPAWFDIPVTDMDRAAAFYEDILGVTLRRETHGPLEMATFPHGEHRSSGALMRGDGHEPASSGTLVYLNLSQDLNGALSRVPAAGGRVLMDKTALPGDAGYMAVLADTEGNAVGLFSLQ